MHSHSIESWTHSHVFLGRGHARNERRTWFVVALTVCVMLVEIAGGTLFGSMAVLADGWHMATHASALGIAGAAYAFARRHAEDARFTFGTGKFGDLAAFASAIILAIVAVQIAFDSVVRLLHPVPIAYGDAMAVACAGFAVNVLSAWLLREDHDHAPHDERVRARASHRHDNNLRAAFVHVMADAATSLLAIGALILSRFLYWHWMDPAVGLIGSIVIASWGFGLIRSSSRVLLDVCQDPQTEDTIRARLEVDGDRVTDLHLWQVGPGHRAAVVAIVSDHPQSPAAYKRRLSDVPWLSHLTVEVESCPHG